MGITNLDESLTDCPFISVTYKVHEKYEPPSFDYDLALLQLEKKITYGPNVKRIDLAPLDTEVRTGLEVIATGWGFTSDQGPSSQKLMSAKLVITDQKLCKDEYYAFLTERMICAGLYKKNACRGDDGGPLVLDGNLLGLTSFAGDCESTPGGYVNLLDEEYREWLQDTISG